MKHPLRHLIAQLEAQPGWVWLALVAAAVLGLTLTIRLIVGPEAPHA